MYMYHSWFEILVYTMCMHVSYGNSLCVILQPSQMIEKFFDLSLPIPYKETVSITSEQKYVLVDCSVSFFMYACIY